MHLDIKLKKYSKHSLNITLTWNEILFRLSYQNIRLQICLK